jgi:TolA-binding protein
MKKTYDLLLRESISSILIDLLIFEAAPQENRVIQLRNKLSSLNRRDPQFQTISAQLNKAQEDLKKWQEEQRKTFQQKAAEAPQTGNTGGRENSGAEEMSKALGVASTAYGAFNVAPTAADKAKQLGKFAADRWKTLGRGGKAGIIGAGAVAAGLAARKIRQVECRKKCAKIEDEEMEKNCLSRC